eukprot:CAMPEP_0182447028 /NCGR_PEP_ID=MMETSP1172-20130603/10417_1 /TAXON_ID=708627 /ORGANISM="Timspurckia oligopyrenoides, Strain CCMP3278" /LENGTH=107 /DNA_ID=CAMNT_0024643279 /DNA_START=118 /DNA_END=441 /DNA_ORIENTATION=+
MKIAAYSGIPRCSRCCSVRFVLGLSSDDSVNKDEKDETGKVPKDLWWGGEDSKAGEEWRAFADQIKSYDDLHAIHEQLQSADAKARREKALRALKDAGFNTEEPEND